MSSSDLLHEPPLEQQFLEIKQEYTKLKDIDYLSHNIFTTDGEIKNLKKKINKFKKLEENMTSKIHEIERHIMEKNDFLQKFGIEYGQMPLSLKSFDINDFTERISNLSIFGDKDSASSSLILRSIYLSKPVFIKAFSPTQENLKNELIIYNHINEVKKILDPSVKSYLDNYFIKLERIFTMDKKIFFDYLDKNNIKQIKHDEEQKTYYSTTKEALFNQIPKEFDLDRIWFIVTEDIEGESLERKCSFLNSIEEKRKDKFYKKENPEYDGDPHIDTRKELINIIFELIYGLYLLNKYFRVRHNDLHFNNVIFKQIDPINKNFIIGNKTIKKRSNIRLAIYDFDKSWITSQSEAENSNDIRIIRMWFTRKMYDGDTLGEISRNINLFESFNLEEMLLRFIHHYSRELDIEEIDPFFKKYLKYKNKYLQLKKNI